MHARLVVVLALLSGPTVASAQDEAVETDVPEAPDASTEPDAPPGYGGAELRPAPAPDLVEVYVLPIDDDVLRLQYQRIGWGEEPSVCDAPCRLLLAPDRYRLRVQPRSGGPRDADGGDDVYVSGARGVVQIDYDHRVGLRSLGWSFVCAALSAMAASFPVGIIWGLIVGTPIAAAFLIPAVPLIFLEDSARVRWTPLPEGR